ncbi:MAG: hypothetical protein FWG73_00190 [Planctomycetaceae bacterium]|nr:hypothetical protein [Planctomycetaceae bacterium]
MLDRTSFISKTAAVFFTLFLASSATFALADEKTYDINNAVVRGQNDSRNNSGGGNWFNRTLNRFFPDDSQDQRRDARPVTTAVPGVPTSPPRPLTAAEIQQSHSGTASTQAQRSNVPTSPSNASGNASPQIRSGMSPSFGSAADDRVDEAEASTLQRMRALRTPVFENIPATPAESLNVSRQASPPQTSSVMAPSAGFGGDNPRSFSSGLGDFAELPPTTHTPVQVRDEFSMSSQTIPNQTALNQPSSNHIVPHGISPFAFQQSEVPQNINIQPQTPQIVPQAPPHAPSRVAALDAELRSSGQASRLTTTLSPQLHIDIEKPPSVTVNQEIAYRIRVTNVGDANADGVVISTEIPSWIDVPDRDATNGDVRLFAREDGTGSIGVEWRINRISPGVTEMLILRAIPRLHRAIELHVLHDFMRPAIVAKVDVREPKLEMELLGPDEILWNDTVVYRLNVRNVGNGNAENVRLDLQQTSAGDSFVEFPDPLLPGEMQELGITLQAGRERENIDLAISATGSHDVKADVHRRIRVLRPRLEMSVQTLPLHFVDGVAEVSIRVWNTGTADADNITIKAELPLGVEYASSSEGGMYFIQQQQNIVEWRSKHIARGDVLTLTLACIPKREGHCRVSVEANEPGGSVLIAGNGSFTAEAVVDLDLAVTTPKGPIELGQQVIYEVQVTNVGTKAAEDVEIFMTFGAQLEPTGVNGGDASKTDDGLVSFEKIATVLPKQSVTVNVIVKANSVGTAQIKAEVVRSDASGVPIRLEKGLSGYIVSRQGGASSASGQMQNEVFR